MTRRDDKLTFSLVGISELELVRLLSEPFLDACYIRKLTDENTELYVVLDCRISSVWINESVSVCCGVNRGGAFSLRWRD